MNLTPRRQSLRFVAFVRRTGRLSHLSCPRCCCHRPFFRFFFVTIVDEFVISLCACFVVVPVGRCCVPAPALDVSSTTVHLALGRRHFEIVWWWTKHGERRTSEKFFSFSRASIRIILVAQELAYHWRTGLENWQLFFLSLLFFNWFILSSLALRRLPNGKGVSSSKLYWQWSSVHDPLPARLPWWWWWMTPCRFHQATAPRFVSKRHFWK